MPFLTHAKTTYTHGSLSLSLNPLLCLSLLPFCPIPNSVSPVDESYEFSTDLMRGYQCNKQIEHNGCFIWGSLTINLIIISFKTSLGPVLPPGSRNWQLIDLIKMIGLLVFGKLAVDPKSRHQYIVVIFRGSPGRAL
jgi:hypothetical protein